MTLRMKNSKALAILVVALFLFSLFPGYGFAEESLDPSQQIVAGNQLLGQENPDGITDDNPQDNPEGTEGDDPQDNPGDNPEGTPSGTPEENQSGDPEGNPNGNPEEPIGTPETPGEVPAGTLTEELQQELPPAIPEKVSLTINHVLDRGDGGENLTYTETIIDLDFGATIIGSSYQV